MKRQGTLVRWEKDRGFGFIRSPDISADVFVHLRDFTDRGTTPQVGMRLTFEEIHVGGKGPRAMAVQVAGETQQRARQPRPASAPRAPSRAPSSASASASGRRRSQAPSSSSSLPIALLFACYAALLGYGVWTGRWRRRVLAARARVAAVGERLEGRDQVVLAVADQVGAAHGLQRLAQQRPVVGSW
jgi:cold shock CspA family protein